MKKRFLLIFLFCLILALIGCSSTNELVDSEDIPIPIPGQDTGVIYGYLKSPENKPVNGIIFLSRNVTYDQPNLPATVSFSFQTDLRGTLNEVSGLFFFDKVEPGENYVISIFDGSAEPMVVKEKSGNQPLTIKVIAGESVYLGKLIVDIQ